MPSGISWKKLTRPALPASASAPPCGTSSSALAPLPRMAGPDEKRPAVAPANVEDASRMLWEGIDTNDSERVTLAVSALSRGERRRLLHTPRPAEAAFGEAKGAGTQASGLQPRVPLNVAHAVGDVACVRALMAQGASPMVGDAVRASELGLAVGTGNAEAQVALTGLFWAAYYGRTGCMDIAADEHGVALEQAIWACETRAAEPVVSWLSRHGVNGDQLKQAARRASDENRIDCVRNLVRFGNVPIDTVFAQPLSGGPSRFWLGYAVDRGQVAVAHALLTLGAKPEGGTSLRERPLTMAMARCRDQAQAELYLPLVHKLLERGAVVQFDNLKEAIYTPGPMGAGLFVALLLKGGVGPETLGQATELLHLAQAERQPRVAFIVHELITMLRHDDVTWAKSGWRQDKSPVVANARARVLELCEDDDDDVSDLPEGVLLANNSTGPVAPGPPSTLAKAGRFMGLGAAPRPYVGDGIASDALVVTARRRKFLN